MAAQQRNKLPPRVRRRPKVLAELDALLRDLSTRVVRDDLPKEEANKLRVLVAQRDPDTMNWLYDMLWKFRVAGLKHFDIARKFDVHTQTSKKWWREAQEWAKKRHTRVDPARHFTERMHRFRVVEERLTTMLMNTTDPKATAMLSAALVRVDTNRRAWLEKFKYFELFPFGKIQGGESGRTAEDFVRGVEWAFSQEGAPPPGEDEDFDDDADPLDGLEGLEELDELGGVRDDDSD